MEHGPAQRDPAGPRDPAEPRDAAEPRRSLGAALLLVSPLAGIATCSLAPPLEPDGAAVLSVTTLGLEVSLGLLALAGGLLSSRGPRDALGLGRGRLGVGVWLTCALGTVGLSQAVDTTLALTGLRDASVLAELDALLAGARGRAVWLAVLGLALAPGLAEELLCRGLLQRALARRLGPVPGIALASLFFGALHLEWFQGAGAMVLGLYLGCIAHWAGSLWPAVICHVANNLLALGATIGGLQPGDGGPPAAVSIAGGLALAAAALALARAAGRRGFGAPVLQ